MEDYQIQGRLDEFDRRISQIENSAQSNNSWDSPDRKFDEIDRRISQIENSAQSNNSWDSPDRKFDEIDRKIQEMQYTIDDLKNKSNSF